MLSFGGILSQIFTYCTCPQHQARSSYQANAEPAPGSGHSVKFHIWHDWVCNGAARTHLYQPDQVEVNGAPTKRQRVQAAEGSISVSETFQGCDSTGVSWEIFDKLCNLTTCSPAHKKMLDLACFVDPRARGMPCLDADQREAIH